MKHAWVLLLIGCGGDDRTTIADTVVATETTADTVVETVADIEVEASEPEPLPILYAQTADRLYTLDLVTRTFTGDVALACTLIDIAVDREQRVFGATTQSLVRVDPETGACTLVAEGSYPNSLSFVPRGTLRDDRDALVGYLGDAYVEIDPDTGAITPIGPLGDGLYSSGDVVSTEGGPTYLSAYSITIGGCLDCLVEIDPKTGALVKNLGSIGLAAVYGLGYWDGVVYGFASTGEVVAITPADPLVVETVTWPGQPSGVSWYGAGSTTIAPQ